MVEPQNTEIVLQLAQFYMMHNMDLTDAITMLKKMQVCKIKENASMNL